jgi:hypothetical protein|tara:strand:- start:1383 stop:1799 length:417 start_codon:yes stop_codon:yes gene_type:complete
MKLFDYIKVLFGKDEHWDKVSNYDKSRNSFMTNRFMSIKFPIQGNLFNSLKIDPVGQAEAWRLVSSKFNRVPGFIYTKVKKTAKQKAKEWNPNPKALELYMKFNEIGEREYKEALKHNPSLVQSSIDILEKQMGNDAN